MKLTGNAYVYIAVLAIMTFIILWSVLVMKHLQSSLLPMLFGSIVFILAAIGLGNEIRSGKREAAVVGRLGQPRVGK